MRQLSLVVLAAALSLAACGDDDGASPDAAPPSGADASPPDATPEPQLAPDLRFKMVGYAPTYSVYSNTSVLTGMTETHNDEYLWSPLDLYADDVTATDNSWSMSDFTPAFPLEKLHSVARSDYSAGLDAALTEELAKSPVITSIDIAGGSFALVATSVASGSPAYSTTSFGVPLADLPAYATSEAQAGRVITALTRRDDEPFVLSTGRAGDDTTFEARVVSDVAFAGLEAAARSLSDDGFTITAFGKLDTDRFVFVGTRVAGTSTPLQLGAEHAIDLRDDLLAGGFAVVAGAFDAEGAFLYLGQK